MKKLFLNFLLALFLGCTLLNAQTPTLTIDLTNVTTIAGNANPGHADGIGTAATFLYPYGVAVDASENVYASNMGSEYVAPNFLSFTGIRKITMPGLVVTTPAGGGGQVNVQYNYANPPQDGTGPGAVFYTPQDMVTDAAGNVYIVDQSSAIRKMTPSGVVTTLLDFANGPVGPIGIAMGPDGKLYASFNRLYSFTYGIIDVFSSSVSSLAIVYEGTDARNFPNFRIDKFAIDAQGNFIFGNILLNKVQKLTASGFITTIAGTGNNADGGDGGSALTADFVAIQDVEVDALNNIYVLTQNRIRKISAGGVVTAVAGISGAGSHVDANGLDARFIGGQGALVMNASRTALYVADPGNNGGYCTIRKVGALNFTPFSTITSYASATQYYSVSGMYLTGNSVITAPAGYEVSLSPNSGFAPGLTFTPQFGEVFSRNIYVRLAAVTLPGTYNGNVVFSSPGAASVYMPVAGVVEPHKPGGAFNFNGSGYTNIPTNNFPVGNSDYTIECWAKSAEDRFNNIIIWGVNDLNKLNGLALLVGNQIDNYWGGGLSTELIVIAPTVNDGNWHHLAATFDGTTRKIYMDGVLLGSDKPTGHNTSSGSNAFLGGYNYNLPFKGTLDEIRVLSKALTQGEITATMNCEIPVSTPGLSAYYKFNQGLAYEDNTAITGITDASPNGNNSTNFYGYTLNGTVSNFVRGAVNNDVGCSSTHTTTISVCDSYTWAAPLGNGVTYTASGTYTGPTINYVTEVLVLTINAITASAAVTSNYNGSQLSCASSTDGIITVTATGGTGTLSYSIDGGPYVSGASANVFTGLAAGVHSLSVKDATGCTKALTPVSITAPAALTSICINSNPILWFGYPGDQTDTITVKPSGGVGPYKVTITMNRPLSCNVITSTGDEVWAPQANTNASLNAYATCPTFGSSPANPSSTSTSTITSATGYSLFVTLVNDAIITATITDANGCTTVCSTSIHAEDVRCFTGNSTKTKVTICHKTGSIKNPCVEMCVDEDKVAEHRAHGDFVGKCNIDCKAPLQKLITVAADPVGEGKLSLKVIPNPTTNYFNLKLNSASREKITVKVLDVSGRVVDIRNNIAANSTLELGNKYHNGLYFAEVMQGTYRVVVRLLKQR